MLLDLLVWDGFRGTNELSDAHLRAVVNSPPPGVALLAVQVDGTGVVGALGLGAEARCDGVFVAVRQGAGGAHVTFVLVELKGRKIPHAIEQLKDTLRAIRARLDADGHLARSKIHAVVVTDSARNDGHSHLKAFRELGAQLHVVPAIRNGPPADLSRFVAEASGG